MIAVEGSIQTRSYTDRDGNKRKAFEIQANNVSFTESKRSSDTSNYGDTNNYGGSYNANSYSKPAAESAPAYTSGNTGDFEEIPMDDDLPF